MTPPDDPAKPRASSSHDGRTIFVAPDDPDAEDELDLEGLEDEAGDSFDDLLREIVQAPSVPLASLTGSLSGGLPEFALRRVPRRLEAPVALGAFDLHGVLGQGGMGEVWRGVHREQGVAVAIKVMSGSRARQPHYLSAFRDEVRAVARLSHPGIVMVFDYGEISREVERATSGHLIAGSPYLAMEFATQGALAERSAPRGWEGMRSLLAELLDALGHAHARGVIHRDLKPGNLLLCGPDDVRPGLKVADFGLAHAMDQQARRGRTEAIRGTPHYMAPEQITGEFRDHGPWTDLYALGCIAWQWATGATPFDAPTLLDLTRAHLNQPPPRFSPKFAVPLALEAWIKRLLEKSARQRFQSAAEAAWALGRLGAAELLPDVEEAAPPVAAALDDTLGSGVLAEPALLRPDPSRTASGDFPLVHLRPRAARPVEGPPLPPSWRGDLSARLSMQLVGAGLGLYGLRAVPMVGREAERDRIWEALGVVYREQRAHLVLLDGPAGTGKSRIAEWLVERAHELAGTRSLRATHSPQGGGADGLPRMVGRELQVLGLRRDELLQRVELLLHTQGISERWEALALAELIAPAHDDDQRLVHFRSPREWHAVVRRLLERLGAHGPVIVWLDDVQWGLDGLEFARHVMAQQAAHPAPVLLLLTARQEALAERPAEARLLGELLKLPDTAHVHVPPLPPTDTRALIQELLGLEGDLAVRLEERCAGNPLFAVQLVSDWVQRGVLDVGSTGFTLKPGEQAPLPDDIHHVWTERVMRLLQSQPVAADAALELAAILGQDVASEEWRQACARAALPSIPALPDALLESRLAQPTDQGWAFVHGMLRESIERLAGEHGRLQALNQACADMLRERYPYTQRGVSERIGRHLLAAERFADAWKPLIDGGLQRNQTSQYQSALSLYVAAEAALQGLHASEDDPRWGHAWTRRARIHELLGHHDVAADLAGRAERGARLYGWAEPLARALLTLGHVARHRGDLDAAERYFVDAVGPLDPERERTLYAETLLSHATALLARRDYARAVELATRALDLNRSASSEFGITTCLQTLAIAAVRTGAYERAVELYQEALERYRTYGNQLGMGLCLNGLAEVQRFRGDLPAAEQGYRKAVAHFDAAGSGEGAVARANLGLTLLRQSRFEPARAVLRVCQREFERANSPIIAYIYVALLATDAHTRDWDLWDKHLTDARGLLANPRLTDKDLAWPAQLAADLALRAEQPGRARDALLLALDQWRRLDRKTEADEVEAMLKGLDADGVSS